MIEVMEMEFEQKNEMLDTIKNTNKPIMIGEITSWSKKDGFVSKSIKLSLLEEYNKYPIIISWTKFIGREHMLTDELKNKLSEKAYLNQKAQLEKLEKDTADFKNKIKMELEQKKLQVAFGIWRKPQI